MAQEFGLGRGLSSLIPQKSPSSVPSSPTPSVDSSDVAADEPLDTEKIIQVEVDRITPNPHQPRRRFDSEALKELTESVAQHGVMQPLVVTRRSDGTYELIAGERRLRAAKAAGKSHVPVLVRTATSQEKMELALIENIQRHDLSVVEEARAYKRLGDTQKLSQEQIAQRLGKSRSVVANRLRLLALPVTVLTALEEGRITEGHAKVLLSLPDTAQRLALFERITNDNLSVRAAEALVRSQSETTSPKRTAPADDKARAAQQALAAALRARVRVVPRKNGGGVISITYHEPEDLDAIVTQISDQSASV